MVDGSKVAMELGFWNDKDDKISMFYRISQGDESSYNPFFSGYSAILVRVKEGYLFSVLEPPTGLNKFKLTDSAEQMNDRLFRAEEIVPCDKSIRTLALTNGNFVYILDPTLTIMFRDEKRKDPLAEGWKITSVDDVEFDLQSMKFYTAIDEKGNKFGVPFENNSGFVVGGVPGSDKSASFILLLSSMLRQQAIDLTIIDGKPSKNEMNYFEDNGLADVYKISEDDEGNTDYETIRKVLEEFRRESNKRPDEFEEEFGGSNYWKLPYDERPKVKMLVMDECQVFLDPEEGMNNDEKSEIRKIRAIIASIIKLGRNAGTVVCLATQKPSADSIPTNIRANCNLRIAMKLREQPAEIATLGSSPPDFEDRYYSTNIPKSLPGLAITQTDSGERERVRFANYSTEDLKKDLRKTQEMLLDEI